MNLARLTNGTLQLCYCHLTQYGSFCSSAAGPPSGAPCEFHVVHNKNTMDDLKFFCCCYKSCCGL